MRTLPMPALHMALVTRYILVVFWFHWFAFFGCDADVWLAIAGCWPPVHLQLRGGLLGFDLWDTHG